ncbi:hypothetical protein ASPFODRAFT_52667 [Aspergillus luchuensis CBS 106.47]|uniref:Uncharacterized protein n=1 Tax=Aspergillus luchuensis (strain CBS 106.47) TaxID=1137211 RepID=A0A1M3T2J8_ASPLC|nr:hypothetical protein ASPFODRAFT_52667 [Aspergillus luchuensis CBS 106.47]
MNPPSLLPHNPPHHHHHHHQSPTLTTYLTHLPFLPLHDRITSLHHLSQSLTPQITPTGTRLINHPSFTGPAPLDHLGTIYITTGRDCVANNADLSTRILHADVGALLESIYEKSRELLDAGIQDGSVVLSEENKLRDGAGACCRGEPEVMFREGWAVEEALWFYRVDFESRWEVADRDGERVLFRASVGMLERAAEWEEDGEGM